MVDWYVHDVAYRTLSINLEFRAKSPFRIGAGKTALPTSPIDLQVLRINVGNKNLPYIPGSSLKGLFRSISEFITKSRGLKVCMAGEECGSKIQSQLESALKGKRFDEAKNLLKNHLCVICKLYGTGSYASHIMISDAYSIEEVPVGVKTGIAIDRRSGSAKYKALYTIEFVLPNAKFRGNLTLTNTPNYALGLISYVLEMVNAGVARIGGFKSRGFGVFEVKPINIEGYVLSDDSFKDLKEVQVLKALDDNDTDVEISNVKDDPLKFLNKFKSAWDNYVSKVSKP